MLGGSWAVIAGSLIVAWAAGFLGVQVVAAADRDIAEIRELKPSALLALPLGGLLVALVGVVLAASGIGL
jgi:hypothetical protein